MLARSLTTATAETLARAVNETDLFEDEALAVIANPHVTPQILAKIAQTARLTAFYSVRLALVAHRQTPQAHAVKLIHYLYWFDLVRLSIDMRVPAPVRRAIDIQLLARAGKITVGERVASARRCSHALVKIFLYDPSVRVFEALLVNTRLREDDLLALINSPEATVEKLRMIADDRKWSFRYAIRKALVMNPSTPRASAASQLRYLSRRDLTSIHGRPETSVYLRRCIERMVAGDLRR